MVELVSRMHAGESSVCSPPQMLRPESTRLLTEPMEGCVAVVHYSV